MIQITMMVCSHLEPDILECEVKWALGNITTNKASRGDGIPVEIFQVLKDDSLKVLNTIKDRKSMDLTEQKMLRRGGKNTQKNYPKKIFMIQITMMVYSAT